MAAEYKYSQSDLFVNSINATTPIVAGSLNGRRIGTFLLSAAAFEPESGFTNDSLNGSHYWQTTAGNAFDGDLHVFVGDIIDSVSAFVFGSASGAPTLQLFRMDNTGAVTQIGSTATGSASATNQTLTVGAGLNHTVLANNFYFLLVTLPFGSQRLYGGKAVLI